MEFLKSIDKKADLLIAAADYIWDNPEIAFQEYRSAKYLCEVLEREGFAVKTGISGIATAFTGTYGSGRPVIGILGEFDALSGMQQTAGVAYKETNHGVGHGCGHNLLAASSLGAAIGIKDYLKETGREGTVIFFGCPAEEYGSGKAFMVRDGVFDGVDFALSNHPSVVTGIRTSQTLANCELLFQFDGRSAHASICPELGRSALDAVELMNMGVNYLREHIIQQARVHYAVTDTGGFSPNVVQPHAEVLYLIRAPKNDQVEEIKNRIIDVAKGAALMTGTTVNPVFVKACSNTVLNHTLQQVAYEKMQAIGVPEMSPEEYAYAEQMAREGLAGLEKADPQNPIHKGIDPYAGEETPTSGSSDVGDVSWVCPVAQVRAAVYAKGTPNHSWQQTAQSKTTWAYKMMLYTAKTMCATAVEVLEAPEILVQARAEFKKRVEPTGYLCPVPADVKPNSTTLPHG